MDTVTHALIGTAIAETWFRKPLGRQALIAGAILAALPDTDIILSLSDDPSAMLRYHRAASHSIILACLAAPFLGWLCWKISKKTGSILSWSMLALLAIMSHDLLDLCTTWGTEIFYPLTDKRYSLDALPIIDPLIILPLIGVFCCTVFLKNLHFRKILASITLVWCLLYSALGLMLSAQALQLAEASRPDNFTIAHAKAIPNTGTILLWHVVLKDTKGNFFTASISSLSHKVFNREYFESLSNQQIERVLSSSQFEIFRRASSDLLLAQKSPKDNEVSFIDMRYAMLDHSGASIPMFFFNVFLDKNNHQIIKIERPLPDRSKSGGLQVYLEAIFN